MTDEAGGGDARSVAEAVEARALATRGARSGGTVTAVSGTSASESDEAVLRRTLVEREARLEILRSKLDMVERENERLRREASGRNGGVSARLVASGGGGGGLYGADLPEARGGAGGEAPSASNAANAVARAEVQDLKQQLSTLRSKLAFKEEELAEARRVEDDARVKLRAANEERTRLAAEVRAERRARAAAGQKRPTSGGEGSSFEDSRDGGASKRQRTAGASEATGGDAQATEGEVGRSNPKPRTLALTLPMAPPDVAATLHQSVVSGYSLNDGAFSRLMSEVPIEVSSFLAKPSGSSAVGTDLKEPVRVALMHLATNPDSTPALTRALIESIVSTSVSIASSAHYNHLTSVLRILSALSMMDARAMSIILGACGARNDQPAARSVTAHGSPPPSLAGIPGLGGAGMGTLVAHPRAQSARIFVPAPMVLTNHSSTATPKPPKTARRSATQGDEAAEASPFLETLIRILHDAKCDAQWCVVDAVLVALIRFASGVGVENGRGTFAAVARKHSAFGSCLKPIAPSGTRFLALMLVRALSPTKEFQAHMCEPLDIERGVEKAPSSEKRKSATIFGAVFSCLRVDCVDENGLGFDIKPSFVAPTSAEQSGVLQEAALRVLRTLAFIGWPRYGAAAVNVRALDVLAAVAVEEYVSPLPSKTTPNASLLHAIRLVKALLDDHYEAHLAYLRRAPRAQRVLARLAHLASAAGGRRETHMGDWLTRILLKIRE